MQADANFEIALNPTKQVVIVTNLFHAQQIRIVSVPAHKPIAEVIV